LDSLKSRLQTTKTPITIPRLAGLVYREEGIMGFYRGLWIPLMTISFVRTSIVGFLSWRLLHKHCVPGAASFTIYNRTKEHFRNHNYLCHNSLFDVALTGGISGAMSGALISFSSTREFPAASQIHVLHPDAAFELVKVKLAAADVHFI
jgi:solute carrier family 25 (mitochondrial carnitine/acylcarnitine transporter), member 20/29